MHERLLIVSPLHFWQTMASYTYMPGLSPSQSKPPTIFVCLPWFTRNKDMPFGVSFDRHWRPRLWGYQFIPSMSRDSNIRNCFSKREESKGNMYLNQGRGDYVVQDPTASFWIFLDAALPEKLPEQK